MDAEKIEKLLSQVLLGGNMSSLRVSGEWLTLYFSAHNVKNVTEISVDTDSWVFVEEETKSIDCGGIDDTDFFGSRRSILTKLYDLTGYDIESVAIVQRKSLRILIHGYVVTICPKLIKATEINYCESWRVITSGETGDQCLVQVDAENLRANPKHPLASTLGSG